MRFGTRPAPETPPGAALVLQLVRVSGNGSLALLAATVVVSGPIEAADPRGLLSRFLNY